MTRLMVWVQSVVCSVENTRCPVSAAFSAVSSVSMSRISPIRMTSGAWRNTCRSAALNDSVSFPTSRCAKSASLCSANSLTCRGVMICSASDFNSSGLSGAVSSESSSPFTRIVAGRPTLSNRSDALRWTIWVMACLKLNVAPLGASGMRIHAEEGLSELDRLSVFHADFAHQPRDFGLDRAELGSVLQDLHQLRDDVEVHGPEIYTSSRSSVRPSDNRTGPAADTWTSSSIRTPPCPAT